MNDEILTLDGFRKWTKERLKGLKDLQKQLTKAEDPDAIIKQLDPESWKEFRKKARSLKSASRTVSSYKTRVLKETARDSKRFTKILEQLQAK